MQLDPNVCVSNIWLQIHIHGHGLGLGLGLGLGQRLLGLLALFVVLQQ